MKVAKNRVAKNGEVMSDKVTERIKSIAFELLRENPEGQRYSEIVRGVLARDKTFNRNTINGSVWNLDTQYPDKVYKPSRGLFRLVEFKEPDSDDLKKEVKQKEEKKKDSTKVREENFYEPFSNWLQNEIEDVTHSITLGGNRFRDKWGTPDVIGKRESKRSDIVQGSIEIVSAEIKMDTRELVTAFGQTCAYKLFSHKCYLVIPKDSTQDEIAKIDSLCQVFGIGLVLYDAANPKLPDFEIRVRPRKSDPDLFYTNKYMNLIEKELFN